MVPETPSVLIEMVPAVVPSLVQRALDVPKKSVPLTLVSELGVELELPAKRSLTSTVPAVVPSLFQSSFPVLPSLA